jgi:hypothetical protein
LGADERLEAFLLSAMCFKFFDVRKLEQVMDHYHGGKIEMGETFGPPTRRM